MNNYHLERSEALWQGAILGSVVHGVMNTRYPDLSSEQSWDGNNYSVQGNGGVRGTITFVGKEAIAAFFNPRSVVRPAEIELERLSAGMPQALKEIASRETLQYLLQEQHGKTEPVITSLFWIVNGELCHVGTWEEQLRAGADIIICQLLKPSDAWKAWATDYAMSPDEVRFSQQLYQRRITLGRSGETKLTDVEITFLQKNSISTDALHEATVSLEEIGIRHD